MNFARFLGEIIFPRTCISCGKELATGVVCSSCFASIPVNETLFCATCKARLPDGKKICHREAPYILGAAGPYEHPVLKELVHRLKFGGIRDAADPLGALLADYLERCSLPLKDYVCVPLPLSKRRRRERGFNQAEEIARRLTKRLPLVMTDNVLARTKHTKAQTETSGAAERRLNVQGCFSIPRSDEVCGKKILLIDDVTTSGATFNESAKALRDAGAERVVAVAVAKA